MKNLVLSLYKNKESRGSSVVERKLEELCVGGSIPSRGTIKAKRLYGAWVLFWDDFAWSLKIAFVMDTYKCLMMMEPYTSSLRHGHRYNNYPVLVCG